MQWLKAFVSWSCTAAQGNRACKLPCTLQQCIGVTRLLSTGSAQQHTATRHAFCPEQCCRALVFDDYTPVCRVDLHRSKCSGLRLVLHSSTQQQGMLSALNPAAGHWCFVTAHPFAERMKVQWHKAFVSWFCTAAQGNRACIFPCTLQQCIGVTRLLSTGSAQQHTATRHAFCPEQCCRALVFDDCTPVCRVDLHRSKCSGLRLLSAGSAQQHRATGQVTLYTAAMHWCYKAAVNWFCTAAHSNKACFLP